MGRSTARRVLLSLTIVLGLSACGGGSSPAGPAISTSAPQSTASGTAGNVQISITLPARGTTGAVRKPAYVSSATTGLSITAYLHSDAGHTNPIGSGTAAVGAGVAGCSASAPVSCVVSIAVPVPPATDSDDFVVALYDDAPVNGAIPAGSHLLGTGTGNGTVTKNAQNAIAVTVLGVPAGASLAFVTPGATVGQSSTLPLTTTVTDADGYAISGTYATPLQLATTNSSITSFLVNGSPSSTTSASTDSVALVYNGGSGSAALSVAGVTGNPLSFVPTASFVASPAAIATHANGSGSFQVSEGGYTGVFTQTSNCYAYASVSPASSASGSFSVLASSALGSCTITISDSNAHTIQVPVTVSGVLSASTTSITLAAGSSTTVNDTVSETNYTGTFTQTNTCTSTIGMVTPASASGPSSQFTFSAGTVGGTCSATIHDSLGQTTTISLNVTGTLTVNGSSTSTTVPLPIDGSSSTTIAVSEPGYSGQFSITTSGCVGTSEPSLNTTAISGPSGTFTISRAYTEPSTNGCGFYVVDSNSHYVMVTVNATTPNAFTSSNPSISIGTVGGSANFTLAESGYVNGVFTLTSNTCTGYATVSPGTLTMGGQVITVTATTYGPTCMLTYGDAYGQSKTVTVFLPI